VPDSKENGRTLALRGYRGHLDRKGQASKPFLAGARFKIGMMNLVYNNAPIRAVEGSCLSRQRGVSENRRSFQYHRVG